MRSRRLACSYTIISSFLFFSAAGAAFAQSFTVSATPTTLTIHPGDQNVPLNVSVGSSSYDGPITVTLTGLPSGITVTPATLTAGGSGTVTLNASLSADEEDFPGIDPGQTSATNTVTVVAAAGSTQATTTIKLTVSISNPSFAPGAGNINLPIVKIDTNGAALSSPGTSVSGTITITSADGTTSYLSSAAANFDVQNTPAALTPKPDYDITLNTGADLGAIGLDNNTSFVLLGNYGDKTLLRNWAGSQLANAIHMAWAPKSQFVALYLNGAYEGNYQLAQAIDVAPTRVNITVNNGSDGYLLKIDGNHAEPYYFQTPPSPSLFIGAIDPSNPAGASGQSSYISTYVDQAQNALFSSTFTDPTTGWPHYFDQSSAVNFYIVNDVMGNANAGSFSSDYLYKNAGNPLLYMGPVSGFEASSGNVNFAPITNPTVPWMQTKAPWYAQLFQDVSGFKAAVVSQFNALNASNGVFSQWVSSINTQATSMQQAETNNFQRWPTLGVRVYPNAMAAGSYSGELSYMASYINLRIAYLSSFLNGKAQTTTTMTVSPSTIPAGSPVMLKVNVAPSGSNPTPSGTVTFFWQRTLPSSSCHPSVGCGGGAGLLSQTATLDGSGNGSLSVNNLPVGTYTLNAIYSGDNTNALSSSSSANLTVQAPLIATATSIASSSSGSSINFTASVIGASGTAAPTGTITFTSNGTTLGTASLQAGSGNLPVSSATFTLSSLPAGTGSVVAAYGGDSTYQGSQSQALQVGGGFTLSANPTSATVTGGQSATFTITVTPQNGFTEGVNLSCAVVPVGDSCSFSPSLVATQRGAATSTLTISTAPLSGGMVFWHGGNNTWILLAGGLGLLALPVFLARRRRLLPALGMAVVITGGLVAVGCGGGGSSGGGGGSSSQTSTITVTGTSRSASQSTNLTLTVTK